MNLSDLEFSGLAIYTYLFIGIVLLLFFRVLNFFIPVITTRKEYKDKLNKYLPFIELCAWLLFFVYGVQFFLKTNMLYALALFIILLVHIGWLSWFALKDIIAGIVFKTKGRFSINETIKVREHSGKIVKFGFLEVEIETETGETIHLPYSMVIGEVLIKSNPAEMIISHTFRLETTKSKPLIKIIDEVRITILHLPWISFKKDPQVKPVGEDKDSYTLEITVYTPEKEYFFKIENYLKEQFGKG